MGLDLKWAGLGSNSVARPSLATSAIRPYPKQLFYHFHRHVKSEEGGVSASPRLDTTVSYISKSNPNGTV